MREDEGMTLVEFLLARIAEDEAVARATPRCPFRVKAGTSREADEITVHAMRWQPERVLAECEAKRRIATALGPAAALGAPTPIVAAGYRGLLGYLAEVYADHPEYRAEWRP